VPSQVLQFAVKPEKIQILRRLTKT